MKKLLEENRKNIWFWLFSGVVLVLFFVMPIMSRTAGNTGDEDNFQIPQGRNIVNYFKTGGEDTTCITFENLKYYGCSFDVVTEFYGRAYCLFANREFSGGCRHNAITVSFSSFFRSLIQQP